MATSNPDARPRQNRGGATLTRYDLVLLVIPAAFALAFVLAHVLSMSLSVSMAAASAVGVAAVADGLFVNPPASPGRGR